jgi:cytochrome c oxidase subunit 2
MRVRLFVESRERFDAWVRLQRENAAQPSTEQEQLGAAIFQRSACVGCHTIRGTEARATIGPDLTHIGGRKTLASGMMDNTPQNLKRWLQDPQGVKVGSKMPNLGVSDQNADLLVTYLRSLK